MDETIRSTVDESLTRRRVLASAGSLAAGGAVLLGSSTSATASVTSTPLSVTDGSYDAPDGTLYSPHIRVRAEFAFEGVDAATRGMIALLIDGGLVTSTTVDVVAPADSGTATVAGAVVDARAHDSADWQPTDGPVEKTVSVEIRFEVRDSNNDVLANASASDSPTIRVTDAGPTLAADVGGDGSVGFLDEEGGTVTQ